MVYRNWHQYYISVLGYPICQFAGLISNKRITVNMIVLLFLTEATVIDFKHGLVHQIQTKSFVS